MPVAANPEPTPSAAPSPAASAAPVEWHVHSASEVLASRSNASWAWLSLAAFLLGAAAMLLVQQVLRRRRVAAATATDWDFTEAAPAVPAIAAPPAVDDKPLAAAPQQAPAPAPLPVPALDLLSIMAEPEPVEPAPVAATQLPFDMPAPLADPLVLELSARRLSATLMNTVLNYELTVSNTGPDPIRSIIIGGDMIGAHASLPSRAQLELSGNAITPLHTIAVLAPGESVVLKGEFKLPLTAITPIRNGNAALFIPLTRFRLEAFGKSALPFAVSRTFVVGEDQDRPGAALKPFRLDLGPRLYSQIGQRELALTA